MARGIFPSSYECDCGHQSHFFERTIREMKADSHRRPERIADSEPDAHIIVFHHGKMIEIICPSLGRCTPIETRSGQASPRKRGGGESLFP